MFCIYNFTGGDGGTLATKKKNYLSEIFFIFFFYDRLSPRNQGIDRLAIYQNKAHVQLYQIFIKLNFMLL